MNDLQGERVQTEEQLQRVSCEKQQEQQWINPIFITFKSAKLFVKEVKLCCCTLD